ncbi:hypothetical protein BDZ89DRAFT_1073164 [Hymenopellis radicata]|nr:hypothetical protein BDZ89DRAFT_1073164 [Hymenopellis radicata]
MNPVQVAVKSILKPNILETLAIERARRTGELRRGREAVRRALTENEGGLNSKDIMRRANEGLEAPAVKSKTFLKSHILPVMATNGEIRSVRSGNNYTWLLRSEQAMAQRLQQRQLLQIPKPQTTGPGTGMKETRLQKKERKERERLEDVRLRYETKHLNVRRQRKRIAEMRSEMVAALA